jgi:hypothetical protein
LTIERLYNCIARFDISTQKNIKVATYTTINIDIMTSKKKQPKSAFAKHTEQQLAQSNDSNNNTAASTANSSGDFGQMSLTARLTVFLLIPTCTGLFGLFGSYLQTNRDPTTLDGGKENEPHKVDFDRDFVTPFLLGLALVIIVGFQTGGFRYAGGQTALERRYALSWPKARRVRKVRRERVIVEDGEENDDDDGKGEGKKDR